MPYFREQQKDVKDSDIGIGVDIINSCNIRCKHCYFKKDELQTKMITADQVKVIFEKSRGKFKEFYILGGEPTLHPELEQIVKLAIENMELVVLVTNGLRLADENFCKKISHPQVMLHMHRKAISERGKELVDSFSQRTGTFTLSQKAWCNVEKYWRGKVNVQLNVLRPFWENNHILEVFSWAREKGYNPVIELVKSGPDFVRGCNLDVSVDNAGKIFQKLQEFDELNYPDKAAQFLTPPYYGNSCTLPETSIHILLDGSVIPCISHTSIPLGNIFKDDINVILNSEIRKAIRDYKNWIVGPCRECIYFDYCHGGCRGEVFWATGCPRASNLYCWHQQKGLKVKDVVPKSCDGCILENHLGCKVKI